MQNIPAPPTATPPSLLVGTLLPKNPPPETVYPPQFTTTGTIAATLTIASAASIGSNMVDVKNGSMTVGEAVLNGVVKGTAATVILNATARSTTLQVVLAASVLAGAGFVIDSMMKKNKHELCRTGE